MRFIPSDYRLAMNLEYGSRKASTRIMFIILLIMNLAVDFNPYSDADFTDLIEFIYSVDLSSEELMQSPELLKSDGVQMAHHGQNGASKEVYNAISPEICFFSTPKWLYNNDNGGGYNSGRWKSITVREWIKEIGAKTVKAYEGDQTYRFTSNGIFKVYE